MVKYMYARSLVSVPCFRYKVYLDLFPLCQGVALPAFTSPNMVQFILLKEGMIVAFHALIEVIISSLQN